MRIDKYLKESRIIKRRTVAKEVLDLGGVTVNNKIAKPSTEVKVNDILEIHYKDKVIKIKVLSLIKEKKENASLDMYELI